MILCFETATDICSVALCGAGGVTALKESTELRSHASQLTVLASEILKENGFKAADLDAVAVSCGPGSYTGLRIGVSAAKGIAYSCNIPLIAVNTLFAMYMGMRERFNANENINDFLFCPTLDARRMEVYNAVYDARSNQVRAVVAEIIDSSSFKDLPSGKKIILFGSGAAKCRQVLDAENIIIVDDFKMSSAHMAQPVTDAWNRKQFEDLAYFEPFYLKDFITTSQVKNILG